MPREEKLSSRLDTLLDAIFDVPSSPLSLYRDIAEQLRPEQLALAQKSIRKRLQTKGEIRTESAFLVAAVLYLTGFPAHRIMHFLSLYVNGSIRLSLYEFAVTTIFRGSPPLSASLVYDITQYTYLEKRLLARKSMEISAKLKDTLSSELLLYLYLLSLRDDLSNENVQLIALIMKNCFPALEVRTRVGGASLEEYGELARAWKSAENRTLANDLSPRANADGRSGAAFDRDSASHFLDKYFSDAALAKVRVNVPLSSIPQRGARETAPVEPAPTTMAYRPREEDPAFVVSQPKRPARRAPAPRERETDSRPMDSPAELMRPPDLDLATTRIRQARPPASAPRKSSQRASRSLPPTPDPPSPRSMRRGADFLFRGFGSRVVPLAPLLVGAVLVGITLVSVPIPLPAHASPPIVAVAPPEVPAPVVTPSETTPSDSDNYVVREGDSLWRIFTSLKGSQAAAKGWADFLSRTTSLNALPNPNQIHPGKVLTLTPSQH